MTADEHVVGRDAHVDLDPRQPEPGRGEEGGERVLGVAEHGPDAHAAVAAEHRRPGEEGRHAVDILTAHGLGNPGRRADAARLPRAGRRRAARCARGRRTGRGRRAPSPPRPATTSGAWRRATGSSRAPSRSCWRGSRSAAPDVLLVGHDRGRRSARARRGRARPARGAPARRRHRAPAVGQAGPPRAARPGDASRTSSRPGARCSPRSGSTRCPPPPTCAGRAVTPAPRRRRRRPRGRARPAGRPARPAQADRARRGAPPARAARARRAGRARRALPPDLRLRQRARQRRRARPRREGAREPARPRPAARLPRRREGGPHPARRPPPRRTAAQPRREAPAAASAAAAPTAPRSSARWTSTSPSTPPTGTRPTRATRARSTRRRASSRPTSAASGSSSPGRRRSPRRRRGRRIPARRSTRRAGAGQVLRQQRQLPQRVRQAPGPGARHDPPRHAAEVHGDGPALEPRDGGEDGLRRAAAPLRALGLQRLLEPALLRGLGEGLPRRVREPRGRLPAQRRARHGHGRGRRRRPRLARPRARASGRCSTRRRTATGRRATCRCSTSARPPRRSAPDGVLLARAHYFYDADPVARSLDRAGRLLRRRRASLDRDPVPGGGRAGDRLFLAHVRLRRPGPPDRDPRARLGALQGHARRLLRPDGGAARRGLPQPGRAARASCAPAR